MTVPLEEEARKRLLTPQDTDEDRVLNLSLRPNRLTEFIGQEPVLENLKVSLQAAKRRKEPIEHILFSGPPGLGKTSLAHIIAHEMEGRITATSGPAIGRAGDLKRGYAQSVLSFASPPGSRPLNFQRPPLGR